MREDENISLSNLISREKRGILIPLLILGIFSLFCLFFFLSPVKYMWNGANQLSRTLTALSFRNSPIFASFLSFGATSGAPLYPLIDYLAISATGSVEAGRLVSFLFGIGTMLLVYKICRLWFDRKTGYLAMLLLAISPLFILNSITIKRETMMLFFSALSFFFLSKYRVEDNDWFLILTGIALILTVLTKPVGVFIFVGVGLYLLYEERLKIFRNPAFYVGMIIPGLVGLVAFAIPYLQHGGIGVPWQLIKYLDVSTLAVLKDVAIEFAAFLPLPTLILAILGIRRMKGLSNMSIFWLLSGVLFYLVFLSGAYHHTHYASLMLPPLAIIAARGVYPLSGKLSNLFGKGVSKPLFTVSLAILIILSSLGYFYASFVNPNQPYMDEMETVGKYVERKAESNGTIALSQNAEPIYFHISLDNVERVKRIGTGGAGALENLSELPDVVVVQTNPPVYPPTYSPQGEVSEWGEVPRISEKELNKILSLDNYHVAREFNYFTVITRR